MKFLLPYLSYLRPHWKLFFAGMVCSVLYGISSGAGIPAVINTVMKDVFENRSENDSLTTVLTIGGVMVLIFVIRGVAGFFGGYFLSWSGLEVSQRLRQDLFDKIQSLPLSYFEREKTGNLITKVNSDAILIQNMIIEVAAECIRQPATMVVAIGYLIYKSFTYGEFVYLLLFFLAIPLLALPVRLIRKHLQKRGREVQESHADITQYLNENLDALVEVRSFGLETAQQEAFHERLIKNKWIQLKLKKYELSQQPAMEIIVAIVIVAVFAFAFTRGVEFSMFAELAAILYFTFDPLKRIMKLVNLIHKTEGPLRRANEILQLPLPMSDPPEPASLGTVQGAIRFDEVVFAYDEEPVLRGLSVRIQAGSSVALVGASGAGKSTFAKLVPRFYDAQKGTVSIDGIDVRQLRQAELRSNIAVVSQHPVLFDISLRENIRVGKPTADDAAVEDAARRAFAHDFISAFEEGYETLAGERGDRLSGGQKQRIAIARAFLKDAPILILDEATSALDSESERYIQKAFEKLMEGKTVLIIAHRFSTIEHVDRVLVFQSGQIVEDGTHAELMAQGGHYQNLFKSGTLQAAR